MRTNISDAEQFLEDRTLDEALYRVEVVEAEAMESKKGFEMLLLRLTVTDGPTQSNGRSPIGTEVSTFIVLDENAAGTPKGRELISQRVAETFAAFGVDLDSDDEHDFVGKEALAKIRPGEDQDGFPTNDVRRFRKAS